MQYQFHIDADTGLPHIYKHQVSEQEAVEVIEAALEYYVREDGSLVALGLTNASRALQVVHREYLELDLIFVITAYDLIGTALRRFKKRNRR